MESNLQQVYNYLLKLKEENQFEGDIHADSETRELHAVDASVFKVLPGFVLYPKSSTDIQKLLSYIHEQVSADMQPVSVSVRAGGTCMSGGSLNPGIVINMTRYMNAISYDTTLKRATVEMGSLFKMVSDTAAFDHTLFGGYPSSKDICGIAGMIGNNASGEKSVRLGATIDNVLGLEVILADGTLMRTGVLDLSVGPNSRFAPLSDAEQQNKALIEQKVQHIRKAMGNHLEKAIGRVAKTASGYRLEKIPEAGKIDLTPLFVGSQGTLGILTRAVLKFSPIPAHTRLLVVSVNNLTQLPFILHTVMSFNPEGVETFDIHTFERVKNFLSEETTMCNKFFPEGTSLVVLAQFSETSAEKTDSTARACRDKLIAHPTEAPVKVSFISDQFVADAIWKIRRSSFTAMRDWNAPGMHAVPCIEDIIVPIDRFDVFIPKLLEILQKYNLQYGFHGHIGDGSLRIIPVFDFTKGKASVADAIIAVTREVIQLVKELEGNMSADHSDGIIRTPFIREFYGEEIYKAFTALKNIFDPQNILNVGKKIGGTEEAIRKYLID